jgi:NAD(P) transhydrogenase subunit beta
MRSSGGLTVRTIGADDAAVLLGYAERVIVVPGYGLAVAQARHTVRELGGVADERH